MSRFISAKIMYFLITIILLIAFYMVYQQRAGRVKVSEFGTYQGYSEKLYDGTQRISDYLMLSNGTKLAYDLILPTKKGAPTSEPLPVLFKYTPYLRTFTIFDPHGKDLISDLYELSGFEKTFLRIRYWMSDRGRYMDPLFRTKWLEKMLKHGYAVIVVERPGTGASFGVMDPSMEAGAKEANEIINWIAAQTWCNGNIGMFGESFQAMVQFAAASMGNPHLKAILPASSSLDNYNACAPGGISNTALNAFFLWSVSFLERVITPVDRDQDGTLLTQALQERSATFAARTSGLSSQYPFRDDLTPEGNNYWDRTALSPFIERINRAGIPVYLSTGWYDIFTNDALLWYANLTVPKRLTVRPLDHSQADESQFDLNYAAEVQRWFDYWLKGIENDIMDEPPIHYYVMGASKKTAWQTSNQWPPTNQRLTPFYFNQGKTGSITSVNDGFLTPESPIVPDAFDTYTVDYTTTSGKHSRWTAINWAHEYPDRRVNDQKALTYTTSPLETALEITGSPIMHLWLATDAPDLDLFVYLEEVDGNGKSTYITEGNLRASHRKLGRAPFDQMNLPFHSYYQTDVTPIPAGEPIELVFSLQPTSYRFQQGNRIRISIVCADADNFETPVLDPTPMFRMLRDPKHPSSIQLPIIQS